MTQSAQQNSAQLSAWQQQLWHKQRVYVSENSAFYQALWQGREIPHQLEDLAQLPLTSKAQLRESQAAGPPFGDYLAASRDSVKLFLTMRNMVLNASGDGDGPFATSFSHSFRMSC